MTNGSGQAAQGGPSEIVSRAKRRLAQLDAALQVSRIFGGAVQPPGSPPRIAKAAQHSDQRPVAHLLWVEGTDAFDVELVDQQVMSRSPQPRPIRPGEILRDDFFPGFGLTSGSVVKVLRVQSDQIEKITRCQRVVTADTILRLARYFGTTPELWLNMQANYDLLLAQHQHGAEIEQITPHREAARCSNVTGTSQPHFPIKNVMRRRLSGCIFDLEDGIDRRCNRPRLNS